MTTRKGGENIEEKRVLEGKGCGGRGANLKEKDLDKKQQPPKDTSSTSGEVEGEHTRKELPSEEETPFCLQMETGGEDPPGRRKVELSLEDGA